MRRLLVLACLVALSAPSAARADSSSSSEDDDKSNRGQFGLSAKVALGYRGIFPYEEDGDYYCGDADNVGDPCQGRSPVGLDLGIEYRALDALGVLFEARFGLEKDFGENASADGIRQRMWAPGIRAYLRDSGGFKFFLTLQMVIDTTSYPQIDKNDLGVRLTPGIMLDPHRTFGLIAFFGPHVSWSRWLSFGIEGGLGIQARFP
jgi:hypothetical protein